MIPSIEFFMGKLAGVACSAIWFMVNRGDEAKERLSGLLLVRWHAAGSIYSFLFNGVGGASSGTRIYKQ
jgi:hypothetical protein